MTLVWSYGGGIQSVDIAVKIIKKLLPMPDVIVMANTSYEISTTWNYLKTYIEPAGFKVNIADHGLANVDLYSKEGYLLLPAMTRESGKRGKLPTYCSIKWKQRVIQRWLRQHNINDCDVWLGMSTDEAERMKYSDLKWYRHIYPLIEIIPTSRNQCIAEIINHGWPVPNKSRCFFCPNQSARDWQQLRTKQPEEYQKAVAYENQFREKDPNIYLHQLALPLEEAVNLSDLQSELFDGCDSGYCWT